METSELTSDWWRPRCLPLIGQVVVDSGEAEWDLLHPRADLVNLHTERGWSSQVLRSARIMQIFSSSNKYFPRPGEAAAGA